MKWKLIIALFLVLSVGSATFFLIQRKSFSSQNVRVVVENADNIASGSNATFRAGIQNDTNATLTNVNLALTLPDSMTIQGGDTHFAVLHWDSISPNAKVLQDVAVAVSPSATQGTISGQADYSPKGFVGRFTASQEFAITPSALGITSLFDLPSSAVSGQEIEGSLHIIPSDQPATNTIWVELVAPQNFTMKEVSPQFDSLPTGQAGNNRWQVQGIQKGQEYVFRFRGIVQGSAGDEENFQAFLQEQKDGNFTTLAQNSSSIHMAQTMLAVTQTIDGASNGVVQPGSTLTIYLAYQNKSDTALEGVSLSDSLNGSAWDLASVSPGNGSWDASTQIITWDKSAIPNLALLQPGDSGEVTFAVSVKNNLVPTGLPTGQAGAQDSNWALVSDARISSSHQSLALGGAAFEGEDAQTLKVQGRISLSSSVALVSFFGGVNTYKVTWEARTTINSISSVRVEATLAPGASWQNVISPSDALLSYSDSSRTLVWNVGDLPIGSGITSSPQKISFEVSIPASSLALGQKLFLSQRIEGMNDFIGSQAQGDGGALLVPGY